MFPADKEPRIWGMARHGRIVGGLLTDCAAKQVAYTQPISPDWNKVAHSRAKTIVYTQEAYELAIEAGTPVVYLTAEQVTADQAAGAEWTAYDLISGRNRVLAGYELGDYHWVYCDQNRAWIVEYVYVTDDPAAYMLQVWLRGMFGGPEGLKVFDRKVGQFTICSGACDLAYSNLYGWFSHTTNLDGSRCVIVDRYVSVVNENPWDPDARFYFLQFPMVGPRKYHDEEEQILSSWNSSDFSVSLVVTVAGNGSTEAGIYGSGITATITTGFAEYGYGGTYLYDPTKGYVAAHWTDEDGNDKTIWAIMTYVLDDPNPGDFYYTGRIITLPDETTIVDGPEILNYNNGDWECCLYWNGDGLYGANPGHPGGTSVSGIDYFGQGADIMLIGRPGNKILAVHKSGATYGPVDMIDTDYGTDFFVYDPVHDEWYHHTGTAPVGVA